MKVSELIKIFSTLSKSNGMTIISLSRETKIDVSILRDYLSKNKDFFVTVGDKRLYTINKFSLYKGDTEKMIVAVEKINKSNKYNRYLFFILILVFYTALMANNP